jgi:hypothetical protein
VKPFKVTFVPDNEIPLVKQWTPSVITLISFNICQALQSPSPFVAEQLASCYPKNVGLAWWKPWLNRKRVETAILLNQISHNSLFSVF